MTIHPLISSLPKDFSCLCTWEEITLENGQYCEYRTVPSGKWHSSKYSAAIVRHLLKTQFQKYLDDVEKASKDCAAAVRRLIKTGPPVFLSDKEALTIPEGDDCIDQVWFRDTNETVSAKLEGCLEGEAREALWNDQKETLAAMEAAEAYKGPNCNE